MLWPALRSDELAATIAWMREYRPNLPEQEWMNAAPGTEMLLALAAWRSQPVYVRARALADALTVARPPVQPAPGPVVPEVQSGREVARRPWTGDPVGPL